MRARLVPWVLCAVVTPAAAQDFEPPRYALHWGGAGVTPGLFHLPEDLAVASDGTVYVLDRGNQRVQSFGPSGQFLVTWGENGDMDGMFANPTGIAVDRHGNVYVADHPRRDVQIFTAAGTLWWQLRLPTYDIAVDEDEVYSAVDDSVSVHSSAGVPLRAWRLEESVRRSLDDVCLLPDGRLAVTDTYLDAIFVMARDGSQRGTWGGDGTFGLPKSVASDGKHVYVADLGRGEIVVLTLAGSAVASFSVRVPDLGVLRPVAVAFNAEGELYVVADSFVVKMSSTTPVRQTTWSGIKLLYRD